MISATFFAMGATRWGHFGQLLRCDAHVGNGVLDGSGNPCTPAASFLELGYCHFRRADRRVGRFDVRIRRTAIGGSGLCLLVFPHRVTRSDLLTEPTLIFQRAV